MALLPRVVLPVLVSGVLLTACGENFEKSPMEGCNIYFIKPEAVFVCTKVSALGGVDVRFALNDQIVISVDQSLELGTAVLSGSTKFAESNSFFPRLKNITIFVSSFDEKQNWEYILTRGRERLANKKIIDEKPKKVLLPKIF